MRRLAMGGTIFLLLVACARSSADPAVEVSAGENAAAPEGPCGPRPCQILEGVVTGVDAAQGHLVVAVDLAWSPELRTDVGETRFRLTDATVFLPVQADLHHLVPGEDVMVRATPESPSGRQALSVVRVDRD